MVWKCKGDSSMRVAALSAGIVPVCARVCVCVCVCACERTFYMCVSAFKFTFIFCSKCSN